MTVPAEPEAAPPRLPIWVKLRRTLRREPDWRKRMAGIRGLRREMVAEDAAFRERKRARMKARRRAA